MVALALALARLRRLLLVFAFARLRAALSWPTSQPSMVIIDDRLRARVVGRRPPASLGSADSGRSLAWAAVTGTGSLGQPAK